MNDIAIQIINKFKELFSDYEELNRNESKKNQFIEHLYKAQKGLHSKIAIAGPIGSGKTTLFNLIKSSGAEKNIMDFAKSAVFEIDGLMYDLWDFKLQDNFSLLWSKLIGGADLIILIFDAANYNLKIIKQFLDLKETYAKYSRILIIANKVDLIKKEELENIKNNINISNIRDLSFIDALNAKNKIKSYIKEVLNLKMDTPPVNIENLIKEAEKLAIENNISEAIIKYENLINICQEYQLNSYLENLQKKLDELKQNQEKQIELSKKIEVKKTTGIPEQIIFTQKVAVKSLPISNKMHSTIKPEPLKPTVEPIHKESTDVKLKVKEQTIDNKKLTLTPEDIKFSLKSKIEKIKLMNQKDIFAPGRTVIHRSEVLKTTTEKKEINFASELQIMIKNQGSDLKLELCQLFIDEINKAFNAPLKKEDLQLAADIFYKIEKEQ
jgi:GTPase SAR1 family protein